MKENINIFYSWQSDIDKNTNMSTIRQSIRKASNSVELLLKNITIKNDESTRGVSGSPNIPLTIFNKIKTTDIFICDLTTINQNAPNGKRKVQNPNVLIELGFAISLIGWERIVILFNEKYGDFNDLPFDIDRHRANKFHIKDKSDKLGIKKLTNLLELSIKSIINTNPIFPHQNNEQTDNEKKQQVNKENLEWILSSIHITSFDNFIEYFPQKIIDDIFHYREGFKGVYKSSLFYIYDNKAKIILKKIDELWEIALSYSQHYRTDSSGNHNYYIPADVFPNKQSEKDFYYLVDIRKKLKDEFKTFLNYIRENYIQINIDSTSKTAFDDYKHYYGN